MSLGYRMLNVDGIPAGLLGLEELFARLYESLVAPDSDKLADLIIDGVREHNLVPKKAFDVYSIVLIEEYQRYYRRRKSGKALAARDYGSWRGYPREQIPWFPTINPETCTNCAACLELCAREVYEQDEDGRIWVAEPFLCMVGCCYCKSVCEPKALLFPNQDILNNYRQK